MNKKNVQLWIQRICGLVLVAGAIVTACIDVYPGVHDGTAAVILIPIGLWMFFTSKILSSEV